MTYEQKTVVDCRRVAETRVDLTADEIEAFDMRRQAAEAKYQIKQAAETTRRANTSDVRARFLNSPLANRTPQEIYTLMQGQIDGWATLADAKTDLRDWLPLMAAAIAFQQPDSALSSFSASAAPRRGLWGTIRSLFR